MVDASRSVLVNAQARSVGYDLVLLAHVLAAAAGLGAVLVAGGHALALLRTGTRSDSVRTYYRPGTNWAGRTLFIVPVLGVVLVAMSDGGWSYSQGWVVSGILLWLAVACLAELVLWPAERRLQAAVAGLTATKTPVVPLGGGGKPGDDRMVAGSGIEGLQPAALRRQCVLVAAMSGFIATLLVAAAVVMVGKP